MEKFHIRVYQILVQHDVIEAESAAQAEQIARSDLLNGIYDPQEIVDHKIVVEPATDC